MNPDQFLKSAGNPDEWRAKAISLRRSADVVWDEFSRRLFEVIETETKSLNDLYFTLPSNVLRNCQFLYSLAAECALKGLVIKQQPKEVIFETTVDGSGTVIDAKIKQIGKTRIDTHNLEKLAEIAGMVGNGRDAEIRELLAFSTFCIHWIGRYPAPLDTSSDFNRRGKLPNIVFNHHYRDLMDPFLDKVLAALDG